MKRFLLALIAVLPITGCGDETSTTVSYTVVKSPDYDCVNGANASIEASGGTFKLTGTCERILIKGANNKMTIKAAKRIDIHGANNVVELDAVDVVRVVSSGNTVKYRKGLTKKAVDVVAKGDNNSIVQGD